LRTRVSVRDAIGDLRHAGGPPFRMAVIDALEHDMAGLASRVAQRLTIAELEPGQILNEDVVTGTGMLLLTKGQHVTAAHLQRLRSFAHSAGIPEPIEVLIEIKQRVDRGSPAVATPPG